MPYFGIDFDIEVWVTHFFILFMRKQWIAISCIDISIIVSIIVDFLLFNTK